MAKNTAPAITAACCAAMKQDKDVVVVVLPSDHVITDVPAFQNAVKAATENAFQGYLVTFGIVPTFPATGDGYVKAGEKVVSTGSTTEGTSSISERTISTTAVVNKTNIEPAAPVVSDTDYTFETNDSLLAEKNKTLPDTTRNIIIISSVTITAAMAAGIIINRKKRKQRRGI